MPTKKDIIFTSEDNIKFNYKVVGIFLNNGKTLLQESEIDLCYRPLGGRVHFGETTKEALIREIQEETGIDLDINDLYLVDIIENFFTYMDIKYHELLFIYKCKDNKDLNEIDNFITKDSNSNINKWLDIDSLDREKVLPNLVLDIIHSDVLRHHIVKDE